MNASSLTMAIPYGKRCYVFISQNVQKDAGSAIQNTKDNALCQNSPRGFDAKDTLIYLLSLPKFGVNKTTQLCHIDKQVTQSNIIRIEHGRTSNMPWCYGTFIYGTFIGDSQKGGIFVMEDMLFYCGVSLVGRSLCDKLAFSLEFLKEFSNMEGNLQFKMAKIVSQQNAHIGYKTYTMKNLTGISTNKPTIFIVRAKEDEDIYELYDIQSNLFIGLACINDYKTSIMMNSLFRNMRGNNVLDDIEMSDDEDDITVSPNRPNEIKMECVFNKKFHKWAPNRKIG